MSEPESDQTIKKIKTLSFTGSMNARYHQQMVHRYEKYDRWFKFAVGVITILGAMLSAVSVANAHIGWGIGSLVITIIGAVVGIILNVLPFGEIARRHLDLFSRWSSLRQDADELLLHAEHNETKSKAVTILDRIQDLTAKKNSINAIEPKPDENLLQECYEDENRARSGHRTWAQKLAAETQKALSPPGQMQGPMNPSPA